MVWAMLQASARGFGHGSSELLAVPTGTESSKAGIRILDGPIGYPKVPTDPIGGGISGAVEATDPVGDRGALGSLVGRLHGGGTAQRTRKMPQRP